MTTSYTRSVLGIDRIHRCFMEVIKAELARLQVRDINSTQALMLLNLGDQEVSVGEVVIRGHYLGSNVTYNVKPLVAQGYVTQRRSESDRRTVLLRMTPKGRALVDRIRSALDDHATVLGGRGVDDSDFERMRVDLERLERFWMRRIDEALRSPS